jgi:hypothetical protein
LILSILSIGAAAQAADGGVALSPGRTASVEVALDVGSPLERAVQGRAYALAVGMDRDQRWSEAAALYQQAIAEWSAAMHLRPSRELERALQKAERERQRSQLLAGLEPARGRPDVTPTRMNPLDEGKLYRTKLMVVRAFTGAVPSGLYARARGALERALRARSARGPSGPPPMFGSVGSEAEIQLLLCATHAAAGDMIAARLARARVSDSDRSQPANALSMAVCAAALGEDAEALSHLEIYVLHPPPHHVDPYQLRDLYVANDWDHLRGDGRFESLFR